MAKVPAQKLKNVIEESEALEMVEFYPSVSPKDSWEPPQISLANISTGHCLTMKGRLS